jgi:dienelactone hydrolase
MARPILAAAAVVLSAAGAASAADRAPLALSPGPHAVGFRVFNQRDASRRLADGSLRPIQVSVWYPTADGVDGSEPLRYRDYVMVAARERTLQPLAPAASDEALSGYTAFLARNGVSAGGVKDLLDQPMLARSEAAPAKGAFPLVLFATGMGGAVQDQAAFAEALASHGYVVATTPSPVRLGARMESDQDVPAMAEEQARDLEVALSLLAGRSWVDAAHVAAAGYSFGARPALLLAGRHPAMRALVSLDGGIGSAAAKGWLSPRALDRAALRTPILHVYEEEDEAMRPDFELLASLARTRRTLARVEGLRHLDFVTFGLASATLPALGGPNADRAEALRSVFTVVLAFIDARVSGRSAAWDALDAGSGLPRFVKLTPFGSGGAPSVPRRPPSPR